MIRLGFITAFLLVLGMMGFVMEWYFIGGLSLLIFSVLLGKLLGKCIE